MELLNDFEKKAKQKKRVSAIPNQINLPPVVRPVDYKVPIQYTKIQESVQNNLSSYENIHGDFEHKAFYFKHFKQQLLEDISNINGGVKKQNDDVKDLRQSDIVFPNALARTDIKVDEQINDLHKNRTDPAQKLDFDVTQECYDIDQLLSNNTGGVGYDGQIKVKHEDGVMNDHFKTKEQVRNKELEFGKNLETKIKDINNYLVDCFAIKEVL